MADGAAAVTYQEIRVWARHLQVFTAQDLADSMRVSFEVGERGIKALLWHGICRDTGDTDGRDPIIEYVPLPPGPTHHPKETPPEKVVGYTELFNQRGVTVSFNSGRKRSQTPGIWRPTRSQGPGKKAAAKKAPAAK